MRTYLSQPEGAVPERERAKGVTLELACYCSEMATPKSPTDEPCRDCDSPVKATGRRRKDGLTLHVEVRCLANGHIDWRPVLLKPSG